MHRDPAEAYVEAAAAAIGLTLLPEHLPGVVSYFELAASMARLVMAHPLQIEDDPAPVFTPIVADLNRDPRSGLAEASNASVPAAAADPAAARSSALGRDAAQ